ncbi:MAG TPA: dethiobiotin synthase [Tepidisphaeraceae bacterium]|nr:dethiobiotin synthase [Tepidisphaeraceae bacterium]
MLHPPPIPGLLVTGTDTGVGKTLIAGAVADWFRRKGRRVAVCKPAGSGCVRRREGLVSEDAEFLAHCADSSHPLDLICPVRFSEPLAPAIAAERAKEPLEWELIDRAIEMMSNGSDVMVVEGVGGLMVPMDPKHTFLDVARWLKLPAIVVARPSLGTINHTLLTVNALRSAGVKVAGVVVNRYPAQTADLAAETNPRAIEKWGKVPVLCVVPDVPAGLKDRLHADILAAVGTVDWARFLEMK